MKKIKEGEHTLEGVSLCLADPLPSGVSTSNTEKALLSEEVVQTIKGVALGIAERYEVEIESIGCDIDHIHLLCGAHPKYAPGQLARLFKSLTARGLFDKFPELKRELWGGEFWTDGYYAGTVGETGDWKAVERYVRSQGLNPEQIQLRLL